MQGDSEEGSMAIARINWQAANPSNNRNRKTPPRTKRTVPKFPRCRRFHRAASREKAKRGAADRSSNEDS